MNTASNVIKKKLIEAILDCLEYRATLESVLDLASTFNIDELPEDKNIAEVVTQLNNMNNQLKEHGKSKFSKGEVTEMFTTILEKLSSYAIK
jgi:hypothetical protein